jgi:putative membrane protein
MWLYRRSTVMGIYSLASILVMAFSVAVIPGWSVAQTSGQTSPGAATNMIPARTYVENASLSDTFEVQSSQLALEKSQNPRIRQFAQMMIDDHSTSSARLNNLVSTGNITAPPAITLDREHAAQIEQLRAASGNEFDRAYITMQVDGHNKALELHRTYASQGDHPSLKEFAATTSGVVAGHLGHAQQVAEALPR